MRKSVFIIFIAFILFSCNKTKPLTKASSEPIPSISVEKITEDIKEPTNNIKPIVYKHIQTLFFEYSGYGVNILKDPLKNEILYTIQKGDKIDVSNVVDYESENKTFIQAQTPSGEIGFIRIGRNPYKNGEYSYIETINVDGVDIKVLKITQSFNVNDGTVMKSLPSTTSENVYEISHKQGSELNTAIAITSDYKWIKIKIDENEGWVPDNCLSVGRGGPVINTPEAVIYFDLIGGNEI
jgi:hypothetical protein